MLVETLRYNLLRQGYSVVTAFDGLTAVATAQSELPDLVLLDIMLPGLDGFEVCRRIRQKSAVPIIMLSAKDDEIDKVVGLELGADDYLTKPFGLRELLARVKAALRRAGAGQSAVDGTETRGEQRTPLSSGDLSVDLSSHQAYRNGLPLTLRPKEFDLLVFFMRNRGHALTRDVLLERVWGYDYPGDTRTVDVHIRWLRQKVEDEPDRPSRLLTVRNVGYKFEG